MDKYDDIIRILSCDQIHIMEVFGCLHAGPNKNVDEHSVKKRLHEKYEKNFDKDIKKLINLGLVGRYRDKNYCLSRDGMIVAKRLHDRKLEKFF
jgi:hypothetical protein